MPRRRRRGTSVLLSAVLVGSLGVAATAGVAAVLDARDTTPVTQRCSATADGVTWSLDPDQSGNAALIAGIAMQRGLPARAVTIALATALQESGLRNLDHGDRDSLGLFQQRPSQGWGTAEQVMDPVYSTGVFYDRLVEVPDWQTRPVTQAAQAVQRSAFPEAYADHEAQARAFASALTGWSPGGLTCTLRPAAGAGAAASVVDLVHRDLGALATDTSAAGEVVLDATGLGGGDATRGAWAGAAWALATASSLRVTTVQVADRRWTRADPAWAAATGAVPDGTVRLTYATG